MRLVEHVRWLIIVVCTPSEFAWLSGEQNVLHITAWVTLSCSKGPLPAHDYDVPQRVVTVVLVHHTNRWFHSAPLPLRNRCHVHDAEGLRSPTWCRLLGLAPVGDGQNVPGHAFSISMRLAGFVV